MTVSRHHARMDLGNVAAGYATIEDLGSLNGTWVDGAIASRATLKDGSTVQIGTFRMGLPHQRAARAHRRRGIVPMTDAGYLTIGKVVKKLQQEYPDLTISKVRYLQDEGLLNPSRTPSGYRLYSQRDVRRLETILYLQKKRFLPLSVIREELERADAGQAPATDPARGAPRRRHRAASGGRGEPGASCTRSTGCPISRG